jgi:hypothetical protein
VQPHANKAERPLAQFAVIVAVIYLDDRRLPFERGCGAEIDAVGLDVGFTLLLIPFVSRRRAPSGDLNVYAEYSAINSFCITNKTIPLSSRPSIFASTSAWPRYVKRVGQPHDLAAMRLFLASDDASYVNGQAIPVDGRLPASMPYAGKPI